MVTPRNFPSAKRVQIVSRGHHITWRELTFDEHCTRKTCFCFSFDRGVCAWETVRGGGQDGWIHVLPLMVALGFTLFLRLPCRDHSIFREVSEALDAGALHADMQDPCRRVHKEGGGGGYKGTELGRATIFSPREGKGTRVHLGPGGDPPPLTIMYMTGFL